MNAIPGDWSLALLLLFGGASTALTAWAAVLLAEIWSQKNAPKERAFQSLARGAFKNVAGPAARILSLAQQRPGRGSIKK